MGGQSSMGSHGAAPLAAPTQEIATLGDPDTGPWVRAANTGYRLDLLVPDIHCAGCIKSIERALTADPAVTLGRVNLSTKRVAIEWQGDAGDGDRLAGLVAGLGFRVQPLDTRQSGKSQADQTGARLLRAMAVAGFAAGNVMLLSVSIWSGADPVTRDLFHWLSALIALPAIAYAGRPFFASALTALAARRLNMDVPISLAVVLAGAVSLLETARGGPETYFDAAIMLVFLLLIGRYFDHLMRARASSATADLLALQGGAAIVVEADGKRRTIQTSALRPAMLVAVAAGERIPADGQIEEGRSTIDRSMVTGEATPEPARPGALVHAGMINLSAPLLVRVTTVGQGTLLAQIVRLMERAEHGRARYVRLADRAAQIYAPAVHIIAALTFAGWLMATGDGYGALLAAIAVLIITCPCALGLAVPAVHVVASGILMRQGILLSSGEALERLAHIDTVVFDKTGTLTLARPDLASERTTISNADLAVAGALAGQSLHPLSRAVTRALAERGVEPARAKDVREHPGQGLTGAVDGQPVRLGSREWCAIAQIDCRAADDDRSELWLRIGGNQPWRLAFDDTVRADAAWTVAALKARGLDVHLLSGDREAPVARLAKHLKIDTHVSKASPADKVAVLDTLKAQGRRVLMVGDGLNDAPALAAAEVSMSPSSAAHVSQTTAGLIFLGENLSPIVAARDVARQADRLVKQNFALAALYNMIAIPVAALGLASPLIAAIAMSSSSLLVTANALRLRASRQGVGKTARPAPVAP